MRQNQQCFWSKYGAITADRIRPCHIFTLTAGDGLTETFFLLPLCKLNKRIAHAAQRHALATVAEEIIIYFF